MPSFDNTLKGIGSYKVGDLIDMMNKMRIPIPVKENGKTEKKEVLYATVATFLQG
jgi:hypothetical protein